MAYLHCNVLHLLSASTTHCGARSLEMLPASKVQAAADRQEFQKWNARTRKYHGLMAQLDPVRCLALTFAKHL